MHRFSLIGLLGGFFAVAGAAQDGPVVTEAEFLSVLDETHPAVRESAGAVGLAEARLLAARTFDNPVLEAVREDPGGPIGQTDVLVSWQIPNAARRPEIEAREGEIGAARRRLAHDLLGYRLAMRTGLCRLGRGRRAMATTLGPGGARRVARGARSGPRGERGILGAPGQPAPPGRPPRSAPAWLSPTGRANGRGPRRRPGIPACRWTRRPVLPELADAPPLDGTDSRVRAAEAAVTSAELARLATRPILASPELTLGWRRQDLTPGAVDGPIFGVAWSVPLFDRRQAARRSSEAGLEAARARLELAERESTAARTAARTNFTRLAAALADARQELGVTERMLDGAEAAFRQGEAGLTDLLETHRSVTEAELAVLDLHEAALAAHRELERLAASGEGGPGS